MTSPTLWPLECEAPRGGIGRHLFQILVDRDKGISNTQPEAAYAILQSWSFIARGVRDSGENHFFQNITLATR